MKAFPFKFDGLLPCIFFEATRDIQKDDELFYDYGDHRAAVKKNFHWMQPPKTKLISSRLKHFNPKWHIPLELCNVNGIIFNYYCQYRIRLYIYT